MQLSGNGIEAREAEIRLKRTTVLLGAYKLMRARYREVHANTFLDKGLVSATVEDYLIARRVFVARDNIAGRVQRHKVAGLMAAAIVKNRPIQLLETEPDSPATRISRDNEVLAVMHGLAVCAEGKTQDEIHKILGLAHFSAWFCDFIYLLRESPGNSGGFVMIFETLSLTYFSENLERVKERATTMQVSVGG